MIAGRRTRAGFSLIEALVVLAVGGMAMALIFSIGMRASNSGFALGRHAMAAADTDITASEVRTLLRSFIVRPGLSIRPGLDVPLIGDASRISGEVVTERATRCAPAGWAGRLTLSVRPAAGGGQELVCEIGGGTIRLLALPAGGARFAFSTDGASWAPAYTNVSQIDPDGALRLARVWILFDAPTGAILDLASSGEPLVWGNINGL